MITGRQLHTATRLQTGEVLIAGGSNLDGPLATTELFDPVANSFHSSGSMAETRRDHTATLLNDGKVLIAGGFSFDITSGSANQSSAELYDPTTGSLNSAGNMSTARVDHTASLLSDGRVLMAGGNIVCISGCNLTNAFATAELYDPATNAFSSTGSMATARVNHTATVLPSGLVVIAGGQTPDAGNVQYIPIASIEIYDLATGSFSPGGSLTIARFSHTATLLDNGQILFTGGVDLLGVTPLKSAELYNPATHISTAVSDMSDFRMDHTATILLNGQVLVAGGSNGTSELASGEIFK
jgi:hypothetical protein